MKNRYLLMLAAAVVLTVSLVVALWPAAPVAPASPEVAPPVAAVEAPPAPEPAPERRGTAPQQPVLASAGAPEPSATVVPPGPGDVVPEPEVEGAPAQPNDPIAPELPQTPRWRLEKTTHLTALLGRDVERLEQELEAAEARGDERRSQQLQMLLRRHRVRLSELREELRELGEAVKAESSAE